MTTTLRPTAPLQQGPDGAKSRTYEVCVNGRPVGTIELATDPRYGSGAGRITALHINEADRHRGRATVAALAAEEVLRGWGCDRVDVSVPPEATAALNLAAALGYTERSRNMFKTLPAQAPALPEGVAGRPMTGSEYDAWLAHAKARYARTLAERGLPEEAAQAKADADHAALVGPATPGTYLGVLTRDDTVVGTLWLSLRHPLPGRSGAFVFDVEVAEGHRGQGHGRSLMRLAEGEALAAGAERIGLDVFADNTPALRLYESLGYEPVMYHLYKQLL
ncbi:GNAT family N-acetyltransferase [Streptomyces spiramyceticus]|uniref:GNAT family N-acetyltransferase n=1 Tax=Streptomyces spiramyceticus TaxID=299717 RepID=UPI00237B2AF1|nr:GNAT family N-acetyltransferase [Streptomyces spiramyceticus]